MTDIKIRYRFSSMRIYCKYRSYNEVVNTTSFSTVKNYKHSRANKLDEPMVYNLRFVTYISIEFCNSYIIVIKEIKKMCTVKIK